MGSNFYWLLLVCLSGRLVYGSDEVRVHVRLANRSPIVGKKVSTTGDRKVEAFLGIPYAKPPVGELRFTAPVAAEPWTYQKEALRKWE